MSLTLASGGKPHGEQDFQAQLANHIARFDHLHGYQWPDLNHYGDQMGSFQLSGFRLQKNGMDIHDNHRYPPSYGLRSRYTRFLVLKIVVVRSDWAAFMVAIANTVREWTYNFATRLCRSCYLCLQLWDRIIYLRTEYRIKLKT